jgi:uncharacterized membrane protein YoaK (UPF0700 family)
VGSAASVFATRVGMAAALAFVSGFVDVVGWLSLHRIYTTHMTGNSTALGQAIAGGDAREIVTRGLPAVVFVAGVLGGALLAEVSARRGIRASVAPGLALTAALLGVFLIWANETEHAGVIPLDPQWAFDAQASLVSLAMGVQTATFRRVDGVTVCTTYITGMLTRFGEELADLIAAHRDDGGAPRGAARHLITAGVMWPGFVAGAVGGALAHAWWGGHALAIPLGLLAALSLLDLRWPLGGRAGSAAGRREQRRRSGE